PAALNRAQRLEIALRAALGTWVTDRYLRAVAGEHFRPVLCDLRDSLHPAETVETRRAHGFDPACTAYRL
ncbi:hypothetical protein M0638_28360, partial [Roseomonas sp. NAR14]